MPWKFLYGNPRGGKKIAYEGVADRAGLAASWAGMPPTYLIADARTDEHCLTSEPYARDFRQSRDESANRGLLRPKG